MSSARRRNGEGFNPPLKAPGEASVPKPKPKEGGSKEGGGGGDAIASMVGGLIGGG